ncbi:phage tail protein [Massilia sp. W12]|uniref:phage tail protein n=1 Tax=Massilia sp. W12 TaxID=3126507 RepID=UPI0030CE60D6
MSGLFGGGQNVSNSAPIIGNIRLQTSALGRAIPWVFGTRRVAPNLIQWEDFKSHPHTTTTRTGKGGGSTSSQTDYTYTAAAVLALASGPVTGVARVWRDKAQSTLPELNLELYSGSATQSAWPWMVQNHPERALAYRGIAYACSAAYDLGSSASLGNHTFEVIAAGAGSIAPDHPDAQPADVIAALLTDPAQGAALEPDVIGNLDAYRAYCLAAGLWVSPAYIDQAAAWDKIKTLLQIGNADCVYSAGVLKIVPYADTAVSSQYGQYNPDKNPVAILDESVLLAEGESIVSISQRAADEVYNHIRIKYADRNAEYADAIAEVMDDADIAQNGKRSRDVIDMPEICDANVAQRVAASILQRSVYVTNRFEFRLPWSYVWLEPLDIVAINYAAQGLTSYPVCITEISEDESGTLTIIAEDFPRGANSGPQTPPERSSTAQNHSLPPGNARPPVIFEPPARITGNTPQVWIATAGGPAWGGAIVYAALDNLHYQRIGTLRGGALYGKLAAPITSGAASIEVDMTDSGGMLLSNGSGAGDDLVNVLYLDGEYIAFTNSQLSGPGRYTLSGIERGALGSTASAHSAGTAVVAINGNNFRWTYPAAWLGKTVYFKLASFNVFGTSVQDLSDVPATEYTLHGSIIPLVGGLTAASRVFAIDLTWSIPDALVGTIESTEIWYSQTPSRASAERLVQVAAPSNSHTLSGQGAGVTYYFWARLIDKVGVIGPWFPAGAGIKGETSRDAKAILDWVTGQIDASHLGQVLRRQIDLLGNLTALQDAAGQTQLNAMLTSARQVAQEAAARGAAVSELRQSTQNTLDSHAQQIVSVTAATAGAAAAVRTETDARVSADSAIARRVDLVVADVNNAFSAVSSEIVARANADGALAQRIDNLVATTGNLSAAITAESNARTSTQSAQASQITTAQATADGATASAQTALNVSASIIGNLSAMQTIKTQLTANGRTYLAGLGVGVNSSGGVIESQILLAADRVAVIDVNSGASAAPFVVQNGQVFINAAFIQDASIGSVKIRNAAIDTLQLAGSAVTIPLYLSGPGDNNGISPGQWVTAGEVTAYYSDAASIVAMAAWQAGAPAGATNTVIRITASTGQTVVHSSDSAAAGLQLSHAATGLATVPPGWVTFKVQFGNDWNNGAWVLGRWSVTLLGVKR